MIAKIFNSILILFAVFMGLKQGWAMSGSMLLLGNWNCPLRNRSNY